MILLTTRGWAAGEIELYHADGDDRFNVGGDVANPLDVATAMRVWALDGARPWASSLEDFEVVWQAMGDRLRPVFVPTGTTFLGGFLDETVLARFGDPFEGLPAFGSLSASCYSTGWERRDDQRGARSQQAGWRYGHPKTSHRQPSVQYVLEPEPYLVLQEGLRQAAVPRTAWIFDEAAQVWRFVSLGHVKAEHPNDDTTQVLVTLDVIGGG